MLFTNAKDLHGHFNETLPIGRSHNVVINEEAKYGVAVGVQPRNEYCKGGLHFFSLDDPANPKALGCNGEDGYVHDVSAPVHHHGSGRPRGSPKDANLRTGSMLDLPWPRHQVSGPRYLLRLQRGHFDHV